MSISVIIPAYNEEHYITDCLRSIILRSGEYVDEIIVVDNNSTDETSKIARSFPNVNVVVEYTKGVNHARQKGYQTSRGDILIFLDADTRVPQGYFKKVYDTFCGDQTVGFVSGPYDYCGSSSIQKYMARLYRIIFYNLVGHMGVGGNMSLRRDTLDKMKGFDTTIAFYGDDVNTARRAKKFGKSLFRTDLTIETSSRRLNAQGSGYAAFLYVINALFEAVFHRPYSKSYKDFR